MSHDDAFGSKSGTTVPGGPGNAGGERAAMEIGTKGPSRSTLQVWMSPNLQISSNVALKKGMQDGLAHLVGTVTRIQFHLEQVDLCKYIGCSCSCCS